MKKRVLILVGIPNFDYTNENSAVLLFLRTIKKAFQEAGHVAEFPFESEKSVKIDQGKVSTAAQSKIKSLLKNWNWLYHSLAYRNYSKNQECLLNQLKQEKPYDLVVEFHTVGSTIGKELAEEWKCPFSVIFDSPIDEQYVEMHGSKTFYWNAIKASEKTTLEATDKIMVYSPACEDYIRDKYKIIGVVGVLPCIVEKPFTENEPDDSCFRILFIGSFLKWHKVDLLVRVFSEFLKINPSAKLQLIGFGQEWEKVKALVDQLNITNAVEMPGFVSDEDLLGYKRGASIAVMPGSNWYGSPLKLFEYAQSGIPFIAPESKTVRSIFNKDEHCLYIDSENQEVSLFRAMTFLAGNNGKARLMAKRSKDFYRTNFESELYKNEIIKNLNV
ncbi:glycosyltransferase [Crocinitomix sp.]|nr:glycosyltransferase [Crocinitomix sp.]